MKVLSSIILIFSSSILFAGSIIVSKDTILMGSAFNFTAVHQDVKVANESIDEAIKEVVRIEQLISSWDQNSQTTLINKNAGIEPVVVDNELFQLILRSKKISELSDGYFDISYASVDRIWDFNKNYKSLPSNQVISKSVEKINYQDIILNVDQRSVFLRKKGMKIGFGAIGKGYAANKAKDIMQKNGVEAGVVNAGGDLISWGENEKFKSWNIGIADPSKHGNVIGGLDLTNTAVVTSGNYEKFVLIEGKKYSHIINPKTGWPVEGMKSATIICQDAEIADALATTVFVLGINEGMELINYLNGVEGIIVSNEMEVFVSDGIQKQEIVLK